MKKFTLLLLCLIYGGFVMAQDGLPENPEDGKCYAKCVTPDEYEAETVRVLTKPAFKKLEVVPPEYKEVTETIVIKPASKKYTYVPAKYKTVTETVVIEEGYNKLSILPSEFSDDEEKIEIKSAVGRWVMGEKDPECESIDPDDCRIMHFRKFDAVYRNVPVQRLVKNETPEAAPIERKTLSVEKEVEVEPARVDEVVIPEVTKDITRRVLVKDESTKEIEVPAEYTELTRQKLVKAGGVTVWREVPCTISDRGEVLPINWNLGSATLTNTAKRLIDQKLYQVMVDLPNSIVEIGSHTDSRGSATSNQSLSERRAKSVVEYLISKGISKDRLFGIGYGENKLLNNCEDGVQCSEAKHALNRRTEFKIL